MAQIRKIDVAPGVFWVEIPAAGLSILCGCPADSIKHLMRRGLVVPVERGGVACESGPNAILLSDSLIQNGAFSNLAEFPVLQMLYRQGMLLPGHPNNTGRKPLLLGAEAQVQAQMRYIHRGNYGLASERELLAAGMTRARAREEMRIKLRFAFGAIRSSEEFLDTLSVGSAPVEVRDGATVRRVAHNVFEFAYGGEAVAVDLNLPRGVGYPSPYPLAHHNIGRPYFAVVHSGDGDGWDVNRPAMSSIIVFQGEIYLIDAGPNIEHTLAALGIGVNEVHGVFHTHAHDDHFCGLTTLMRADHRIRHYATAAVRASVAKKWAALLSRPESEFERYFEIHTLKENVWNDVSGLGVRPVFSPHPVETTVFFFRALSEDGHRVYAHLADLASRRVLDRFLEDDPDRPGISRRLYDRTWKAYHARADIKKIDIGGGLIHGDAEDFAGDPARRIILSHTALPLTDRQKEIGSGAVFGTTDVLIEGTQDNIRSKAYRYLRDYLPRVRQHELKMLMNGDVITVSPETILFKCGQRRKEALLIVTGVVELLDSGRGVGTVLSAGALVGELPGFTDGPGGTYRAKTYVRALRLPMALLGAVLADNDLTGSFREQQAARVFLRDTWLFSEALSTSVQNALAESMVPARFARGEVIAFGADPAIYVLAEGGVELCYDRLLVDELRPGDFFGEGYVLFGIPCITTATARTEVLVQVIHAGVLRDIPTVRWKLFETYRQRMATIVDATGDERALFRWRREYSTGYPPQDKDHKQLLDAADKVYQALLAGRPERELEAALRRLVGFTAAHFSREIGWYKDLGFPELEYHKGLHEQLMAEIQAKAKRFLAGAEGADGEFLVFFKNWLIDHIMTEDRKFGRLLELR